MEKNRVNFVDYLKGLGIILVVLGHVNSSNEQVKSIIYSFHMPLFFFISGLFLYKVKIKSVLEYMQFIRKKLNVLLIPYIIWGLLYSGLSIRNVLLISYGSYHSIGVSNSLSSLWFLITLFICWVFWAGIELLTQRRNLANYMWILIFMLMDIALPHMNKGYPLCMDIAISGLIFMLLGDICNRYLSDYIKARKVMDRVIIILLLYMVLNLLNGMNNVEYVLMANRRYGQYSLFLLTAFVGCMICICMWMPVNKYTNILGLIGRNSMPIFLIHKPLIELLEKVIAYGELTSGIILLSVTVLTILLSLVISKLIERYIPVIIGR